MKSELSAFFDLVMPSVDRSLDALLPPAAVPPALLHEAMRYSVFAGGKRLRPALCLAGYSLFAPDWEPILPVASAIEMIHTYSLIHDDLPAMDDDDFRRGNPSCHKKFGEAIAILAGDALLTRAFEVLAGVGAFPAARVLEAVSMISIAAGAERGMIAGQVYDLEAEGRPPAECDVEAIHRAKTGALIAASVSSGALLGGADPATMIVIRRFGENVGLAFQVVDDILDETGTSDKLGKTTGKDRDQQKATYPARYGLERSRAIVREVTDEARYNLASLGERAGVLLAIADYLENRSH